MYRKIIGCLRYGLDVNFHKNPLIRHLNVVYFTAA